MVVSCGATHLGFPFRLAHHREDITPDEAAAVISSLPPSCHAVLITYLDSATKIAALARFLAVTIVQLHGPVNALELAKLRRDHPDLVLWKSLIVRGDNMETLIEEITVFSGLVDAFITDTYDRLTGAVGATGLCHDWNISRRLVDLSRRPVILAGGLTPWNVGDAITLVRPAGVDVHTGVEDRMGRKTFSRVCSFVRNAHDAFNRVEKGGTV